jgi:uncharacterized membrane protein
MNAATPALFALVFLLTPALLIVLSLHNKLLDKLGLVLLCFASGIALNALLDLNTLFDLNTTATQLGFIQLSALQTQVTEIAIALALPLLVFSVDLRLAMRSAGLCAKSMLLALLSVTLVSFVLTLIFAGKIEQLWQVAGLAVGAYTGGGPNMAAIHSALEGDTSVFISMTSYDILLSAIYLLFAISIAKPIFKHWLPSYQPPKTNSAASESEGSQEEKPNTHFDHLAQEGATAYLSLSKKRGVVAATKAFLASALVVGLALFCAALLPPEMQSTATIILITSFGLAASLVPKIRAIKESFQLGMYLVLVFCFTMGSMTDLSILTQLDLNLFAYVGGLITGALLLHALLCKLFGVDVDTFLVTSGAAIMSVPFIPMITSAIKNKDLLVPGFAAAIMGYAIGNYLGIAVAKVSQAMLGL